MENYRIAWSGFKILQTIHITDLNQIFQIQDANGSTSLSGYQALLNYRKLTVEDFALNGYACEDYTETDTPDCPQDTLGIASGSLALIRDSMSNKTPQTIQIPNQLHRIELCDGREDHLLNEELSQLQGGYVITQTIDIPDTLQTYTTATLSGVSQQPLEAVLAIRSSGQALYLEGFEPPNIPGDPGTDVWNGGDPFGSVLSELREAIQPEVSYYIQDHLGNTRVMYHTDLVSCQDYDVLYRLEHVLDYYPYGKTLREYVPGPREKFQSTEHERDLETGLDHRGARMYDGDVGRFLGVDPLADHPNLVSWSTYHYTYNNPILFTDPDGRCPDCPDEVYVDIAAHVYDATVGSNVNGWQVVEGGIYENSKTGFKGALYIGTAESGYEGEYIFATAGTEFTSAKDWANNIGQAFGKSAQYSESIGIANELVGNEDYQGVSFTGHSLGGGLASANALSTEGKAVTFNAAGLSNATMKKFGMSGNVADIKSYVVSGEVLDNYVQKNIGLRATANHKVYLPGIGKDAIDRHSMSNVKAAFNLYQEIVNDPSTKTFIYNQGN